MYVGAGVFGPSDAGNAGQHGCRKMLVVWTLTSTHSLRKSVGLGRCSFSQAGPKHNSQFLLDLGHGIFSVNRCSSNTSETATAEFRPSQMLQSRTSQRTSICASGCTWHLDIGFCCIALGKNIGFGRSTQSTSSVRCRLYCDLCRSVREGLKITDS